MIISTQQTNRRTIAHVFSTPTERTEAAAIATALGRKVTCAGTTGLVIITLPWYQTHPTAARWLKIISLMIITDYTILIYWAGRYAYRTWKAHKRACATNASAPTNHARPTVHAPQRPSPAAQATYAAINAAPQRIRTCGPIRVDTDGAVYYYEG